MAGDLHARVQGLLQDLRAAGLQRTALDGELFLAALQRIDLTRPWQVQAALHATLARRPEELPVIDAIFVRWWRGEKPWAPPPAERLEAAPASGNGREATPAGDGGEETEGGGISMQAVVAHRDLRELDTSGRQAVAHLVRQIIGKMAWAIRRRLAPTAGRGRPDWRATLRRAVRTGGEPVQIIRRPSQRQPGRLLLVLDISGSMAPYAETLLLLAHGLQSRLPQMETLLVATRPTRVTQALARTPLMPALAALSAHAPGWGGGTRLAMGLREARVTWPFLLGPTTRVVLLSDGLESESPEALGYEMHEWHRRVERLIWLNPLLVDPDFAPIAGGIAAALPHVDQLAPGHSLAALARLPEYLKGPREATRHSGPSAREGK